MIPFVRVDAEKFWWPFLGMLEDVLLKISGRAGKGGDRDSGQSLHRSAAGFTVVESIASCPFCSLPTITESSGCDPSADVPVQQLCSSRKADAALGFSQSQVTDMTGSDRLKTLRQIRSDCMGRRRVCVRCGKFGVGSSCEKYCNRSRTSLEESPFFVSENLHAEYRDEHEGVIQTKTTFPKKALSEG